MAENKQYMTQDQDNGKVMISEDVIHTIIESAVTEVDGMAGLTESKKTRGKSIRVNISENNEVSIDCSILVAFGRSVVDVSANAQEVIANAVESTAGVNVSAVNVFVCGIVHQ